MKKRDKKKKNQERQEERGRYERDRKKRNARLRESARLKFKKIKAQQKEMKEQPKQENKLNLWSWLYGVGYSIGKLFRKYIACKLGFHDWRLCAGKPGDPMYACIKCWARSKTLWTETNYNKG